ncbi:hypothetical protein SeLEV6574_g06781, partial [Synchytrium endobioticum]
MIVEAPDLNKPLLFLEGTVLLLNRFVWKYALDGPVYGPKWTREGPSPPCGHRKLPSCRVSIISPWGFWITAGPAITAIMARSGPSGQIVITDLTGLLDRLQSHIEVELDEKAQLRTALKTALALSDQHKTALSEMSSLMRERDSHISYLQNERQTRRDEADQLLKEVARLKEDAVRKDSFLCNASAVLKAINRQREADYNEYNHAVEAVRQEAAKVTQLKQQLASLQQNNYRLTAEVGSLRAGTTNYTACARVEVEDLKLQITRLNKDLPIARNQHPLAMENRAHDVAQVATAPIPCLPVAAVDMLRTDEPTVPTGKIVSSLQSEGVSAIPAQAQRKLHRLARIKPYIKISESIQSTTDNHLNIMTDGIDPVTKRLYHAERALAKAHADADDRASEWR